ncbi:hypothetical protein VB151_20050, partial [Xanthomonas fragariae]|uniref:hypothetical protein n=1 Tax=Xanthomonas fragariae TaxID=48664 RepID=UPI002B1E966D
YQTVERVMPLLKFDLIASDEGQTRQMPDQQIVAISRFENGRRKWSGFKSTLLLPDKSAKSTMALADTKAIS